MFPKTNPKLKGIKIESSDDAIKRGLWVQRYADELPPEKAAKMQKTDAQQAEVAKKSTDAYGASDYAMQKRMGWR